MPIFVASLALGVAVCFFHPQWAYGLVAYLRERRALRALNRMRYNDTHLQKGATSHEPK